MNTNLESINIHCVSPLSCENLVFESSESNYALNIDCFDMNSCQDIKITADGIYININMYKYSRNINIVHPNVSNINMECDNSKNKRYIEYNIQQTEKELLSLFRLKYEQGNLPCEGITIDCTVTSDFSQSCNYEYVQQPLNLTPLLQHQHDCYWMDITELFHVRCDGNCVDTFDYYQYNMTIYLEVEFETNDTSSICYEYFSNINETSHSLNDVNGIFGYLYQIHLVLTECWNGHLQV